MECLDLSGYSMDATASNADRSSNRGESLMHDGRDPATFAMRLEPSRISWAIHRSHATGRRGGLLHG